jgi:hypothetical protein
MKARLTRMVTVPIWIFYLLIGAMLLNYIARGVEDGEWTALVVFVTALVLSQVIVRWWLRRGVGEGRAGAR